MASYKQLQLFVDKELDHCLQSVFRPFTEHVYFPEISIDPLEIESMFHEQYFKVKLLLIYYFTRASSRDSITEFIHF